MTVRPKFLDLSEIFRKAAEKFDKLFELDEKKIMLVISISLAIFILDFIFVLGWQNKQINAAKPKIKQSKSDIETINKNFANIDELKKKFAIGKKEVISEGELSILLEEISNIANKNSVLIMRIKPVSDPKASKKEVKSKTQKAVPTVKFTPVFIDIELACGYHNLGSFINSLENSVNFMQIQNIKVTTNEEDYTLHKVTLLIKTYIKK